MRRSVAASFVLSAGFLGAWLGGAGCTASGTEARINGPSYDLDASADDAGTDASTGADGAGPASFDGAPTEGGSKDGAPLGDATFPGDASDAASDAPAGDAGGCTARTAVLGGNDFSLFGATSVGGAALTSQALPGSVVAAPALVAFGGGFEALLVEAGDGGAGGPLFGLASTGGGWSAPAALGGGADAIDAPASANVGGTLHAVYLNPQHLYFHATFGTTWDTGADLVRAANDAGATAFGPVRAAAAGTATQLVIAYEGNSQLPYAQTWTSGSGWDDGVALGADLLAVNTPMAIVALDGGASDLLAVYAAAGGACASGSGCLYAVARTASTRLWSAPALVNATAYVNGAAPTAPTLAPLSGGRALVAWQGANGEGYESVYAAGAWATPAQLTSAQLAGAPSLARGVCGDDAIAAYVSLGSVYTTRLAGGAWTAPVPLAGASGITSVTIATAP